MPFSVLVLYQIRVSANDVCDTFNIFVANPETWNVTGLLNAISFTELVLIVCSGAAQRRLATYFFIFPFLNHSHLLLSLWHSVSLTNSLCSAFCFHSFNRFPFFSFLLTLAMYLSRLISAAAVLTRASLLCVPYFDKLHIYFSTQSSTLTRPLPPSLLDM